MTTRLALIGSAICGRMNQGWVRTWPHLLQDHFGQQLEIVSWGQGGGLDIEDYAQRLSTCTWDLAWIFHTGYRTYTYVTEQEFAVKFQPLDTWLRDMTSTGLRQVLHFTRHTRQYQFLSGARQHGIIEQLDWDRHHRVRTTADISDNYIDQVGNWLTAQRLIQRIVEFQQHRAYTLDMQRRGLMP